jgi:hypothetical protein
MTALTFVFALALTAAPAQAQATRTWVSGVGDDVNPCSRTAPCKTFAGAISKTAAGGEINCLDPGGYGTVTITKSITIDCEDTQGSILASGTNGVNLNDSATATPNSIRVILRGLSINGAGTTPGLTGVNFVSGASLTIEDCLIQNFTTSPGAGVRVSTSAGAQQVQILNSHIVNNSLAGTGAGVFVQPSGTAAVRIDIENTQMAGNTNAAFRIDTSTNTGSGIRATINNSELSASTFGIIANQPATKAQISIMVTNSTISEHTSSGIFAAGTAARVRIGGSTITNNATAASVAVGGVVNTYGDNYINGNTTTDGTFTAIPLS